MNKYIRYLTVGLLALPLFSMATNSLAKETTPVQSYQAANGSNTNENENPEWVSASKYLTSSNAAKESASNSPKGAYIKPALEGNSSSADPRSVRMLEAELTQINQNNLLFQQKVDERLIELSNRDRLLEQQYRQLAQAISVLSQELIALKKAAAPLREIAQSSSVQNTAVQNTASSTIEAWVHLLKQRLGPMGFKVAVAGVTLLLIMLLWIMWPRNKKKKEKQAIHEQQESTLDDTEAEYDYMGSEEGIPAKLDLARTYIAMEDYKTARKVLAEVSQYGDQSHKLEAQAMLDEIPAES